jgi:adenylate kinase
MATLLLGMTIMSYQIYRFEQENKNTSAANREQIFQLKSRNKTTIIMAYQKEIATLERRQ